MCRLTTQDARRHFAMSGPSKKACAVMARVSLRISPVPSYGRAHVHENIVQPACASLTAKIDCVRFEHSGARFIFCDVCFSTHRSVWLDPDTVTRTS